MFGLNKADIPLLDEAFGLQGVYVAHKPDGDAYRIFYYPSGFSKVVEYPVRVKRENFEMRSVPQVSEHSTQQVFHIAPLVKQTWLGIDPATMPYFKIAGDMVAQKTIQDLQTQVRELRAEIHRLSQKNSTLLEKKEETTKKSENGIPCTNCQTLNTQAELLANLGSCKQCQSYVGRGMMPMLR